VFVVLSKVMNIGQLCRMKACLHLGFDGTITPIHKGMIELQFVMTLGLMELQFVTTLIAALVRSVHIVHNSSSWRSMVECYLSFYLYVLVMDVRTWHL
jgi:hypothetical protein